MTRVTILDLEKIKSKKYTICGGQVILDSFKKENISLKRPKEGIFLDKYDKIELINLLTIKNHKKDMR